MLKKLTSKEKVSNSELKEIKGGDPFYNPILICMQSFNNGDFQTCMHDPAMFGQEYLYQQMCGLCF